MTTTQDNRRDEFRQHILDAIDKYAGGPGWTDADLPSLFAAVEPIFLKIEARSAAP